MNTHTQLYLSIPTVFAADLLHTVIYPHCFSSFHGKLPVNPEGSLKHPMIEIKDVEKSDGRDLELSIHSILLNFRPSFLLSLYNWVCSPIWDTATLPEAASWPLKIGRYVVKIVQTRMILLNSTSLPEPADNHLGYPTGATFHSALTNRNRTCFSFQVEGCIRCTMNAMEQSMNCVLDLSISNTLVTLIRNLFQDPAAPTNVQFVLNYGNQPNSSSYITTISIKLKESLLLLPIHNLSQLLDILSFQMNHLYASIASSNKQGSSNSDILVLIAFWDLE